MEISGKRLRDINMRNRGIIAGITTAEGKAIVPSGDYRLQNGDILLVTAGRDSLSFIQHLFG
jgi:Trk K+ transport system NAD-binding subunit